MQTRPEIAEVPEVLVELVESAEEQSEDPRPTTNSHSAAATFLAAQLEPQPAALGDIEHVVVLDLMSSTAAGVAGLEGALPSSQRPWLDRLMNIVLASIGLVIASPLMLLVAIAVKPTSKGPLLSR